MLPTAENRPLSSESRAVKLAIVIVNYKTPSLVVDCVEALRAECLEQSCRIVIVDNCSGDDSVEVLSRYISTQSLTNCALVQSDRNGGFSYGNNEGIKSVDADYFFLLNSDTIVRPGSVRKLIEKLKSSDELGVVAPRLEFLDETPQISCFRQHGIMSELLRGAGLAFLYKLLHKKVVAIPLEDNSRRPAWVSFAAVMIRREVFDQIGVLDDGYFMYFEDAEFCSRAKSAGWEIEYLPEARVVHLRGGSSNVKRNTALKKRLPQYFYRSRARYFRQKGGVLYLIMANIAWAIGRFLSLGKLLFGKNRGGIEFEAVDLWIGAFSRLEQRSS